VSASRQPSPEAISGLLRDLASFRYTLRKFLRFSEKAARLNGVTPQQHQLMLGIAGFAEGGAATISELSEFLQEKHNSVVGLVERAEQNGLVRRKQDTADRRVVRVSLTAHGTRILARLSLLHIEEVNRIRAGILAAPSHSKPVAVNASRSTRQPRNPKART
jgi:DNA-binding MarR family transcriptional regulator